MHPELLRLACCCGCYPVWYRVPTSYTTTFGGLPEDPAGTILRSPLFAWNAIDPTQHGPVPKFMKARFLPPENASSGGIDGPTSPLDRRGYDLQLVAETAIVNDADPQDLLCSNFLQYCGKHAIDLDVPMLDGSGNVNLTELRLMVLMYVQDWDYTQQCRFPRFVIEFYAWATHDEPGLGSSIMAAYRSTGGPGDITSIASGWPTPVALNLGYVIPPPSGTGAIAFPPLYNPDLPILVSPKHGASTGGPSAYTYPLRNRRVQLECTTGTTDVACGDDLPPEPPTSSLNTTYVSFSTSGGTTTPPTTTGGTTGGGGSGGSTSGGGVGGTIIHPKLCFTGALQTDLFVDYTGIDDGQVFKHSDGRCVYVDLQDADPVEGTPNLDTTDPQVDCDRCKCSTQKRITIFSDSDDCNFCVVICCAADEYIIEAMIDARAAGIITGAMETCLNAGGFYLDAGGAGADTDTVARLISGTVDNTAQSFLDDDQVAAGFILLDTSLPMTDCVIRVGGNVVDELFGGMPYPANPTGSPCP